MPTAPLRPCLTPRCRGRVKSGRCAACARAKEANRGSAHARGYNRRWERYRRAWLAEHPRCGDRASGPSSEHSACRRARRVIAGNHVDHIVPHHGDEALFWDPLNHQTLCVSCHSRKTMQELNADLRGAGRVSSAGDGRGVGVESVGVTPLRTARPPRTRVDDQKVPVPGTPRTRAAAPRRANAARRTS